MKVLVTGGAGFIGSNVVDGLILEGHKVVVVDNLTSGKKENLNPDAKFYCMDIRDNNLKEIFERENPDVVSHQAAQIDVRKSVSEPVYDAEVNILGTINILECARAFGVKKIIFASSGGVMYGECDTLPASEDFPAQPLSPYGVAKRCCELYLEVYQFNYGTKFIVLRYANVYGPRQDPNGEAGVVAIFTLKMLKGELPVIYGDGEQIRDYVYIDEVVRANMLALKTDKSGIYNIGTGAGTSVNGLYKNLTGLTGFNSNPQYGPWRQGELKKNCLNCGKALEDLGWRHAVGLEKGLKKTVEYFKNK